MIQVTKVTPVSLGYLTLGGFVVAFSTISLLVKEKLYVGEVVLGTGFGVIIGPYCANAFDPRSWGSGVGQQNAVTLEVMRVVLATGLFAMGVELPKAYVAEHARSLVTMVVPTMALGWLISAGIIHALFPALSVVSSLVISACLTPTDPVLAAAIIGGNYAVKNVPGHIRRLLCAESATNDGLAYPFLSISIYLAIEGSKRVAFGKWFLIGWLYQVILGTTIGAVLGLIFSYLMKVSQRKGLIDRESFLAQHFALAILVIGIASTIGSDDLLAAFAAGTAVSWDGHFNKNTEDESFSSVVDLILNCACFIYIGAWIPFEKFNVPDLGLQPWRLTVLFLAILILRRIPCLLLLYKFVPDIRNWREALFCGHFGPMGVGAIFVSTLALTELPEPNDPPGNQNELLAATIHPIVSFVVLCSILVHGLSIPAFWFGRKAHSRTMSLTATWTRTLTSRGGINQPDWLLSARRAPAPFSSVTGMGPLTSTADLERNVNHSKSASQSPNVNGLAHGDVEDPQGIQFPENLGILPEGLPEASYMRSLDQSSRGVNTRPISPDAEDWGSKGVDDEGNGVHAQVSMEGEIVGLGRASLHDARENEDSLARERKKYKLRAQEATEVHSHPVPSRPASASKQEAVIMNGDAPETQSLVNVAKQVQLSQ
ncbi:hypothetical protein M0805_006383 [Coniferiporia weirii]|nr:hypothetical protein M0805_006383 [Coniferiporia weirii]